MAFASLYPRVTRCRRIQDLCGTWDFQFDPDSVGAGEEWYARGLPDPVPMPVPSSFNDIFCERVSRDYCGDVWYARRFVVPPEWACMSLDLRFDAATHRADVYVNGRPVAFHEGGFTPFVANIDDVAIPGEENLVVVRVNNELSHQSLPAGTTATLRDGTKVCGPYFDFYNYAGLQRAVRLLATPRERIEDLAYTVALEGADARVSYRVETNGSHDVFVWLTDEEGVRVASATGAVGELCVKDARLWELRRAYLYRITVQIADAGRVVDEWWDTLGLRTVEVQGTDILLNGRAVYLKGFGRHEDSALHGRGFDPVVARRDFELMRWCGANSFRCSHYPYAEEELYEADRAGLFVIDEVAAVGMMPSLANFADAAGKSNGTGFFDDPEVQTRTLAAHLAAIDELIARDQRHASVCAWSLFNEADFSTDAAVTYAEQVFARAREADVQGRPCTFANMIRTSYGHDLCAHLADFIMLNRYNGWYMDAGPGLADAACALREELLAWGRSCPGKPFVFSEFGADTMAGLHALPSTMWSEEYQAEVFRTLLAVFDEFSWVVGEQAWNLCDFATSEGIMRVGGNRKGVFTRDRQPKAVAWLLCERWAGIADYRE